MKLFNGKTHILDNKPISPLQCDACFDGGGTTFLGDFFYINCCSPAHQLERNNHNCYCNF
jgi:hypothetical protein